MKNRKYYFILLVWICWTCTSPDQPSSDDTVKAKKTPSRYLRWVGDSKFDANQDDSTFQVCHGEFEVKQYFNMSNGMLYQGEKKELKDHFLKHYQSVPVEQSGWIRIRFIVNCEGSTGRFRMIAADKDYQPQLFDTRITEQLMSLTQDLNGWLPQYDDGRSEDYYQYLIFKIEEGQLIELLP